MQHGGQVESCRTKAPPSGLPMTDHINNYSPLNTSATVKDITDAFNVSRPTHVAVYPAFLRTVQDAILATDMAKAGKPPKVFTVLERVEGLPKVLFPLDDFATMGMSLIRALNFSFLKILQVRHRARPSPFMILAGDLPKML